MRLSNKMRVSNKLKPYTKGKPTFKLRGRPGVYIIFDNSDTIFLTNISVFLSY